MSANTLCFKQCIIKLLFVWIFLFDWVLARMKDARLGALETEFICPKRAYSLSNSSKNQCSPPHTEKPVLAELLIQKSCWLKAVFGMVSVHSHPQQSCSSDAMGSTLHVNSHWCTDISVVITGAFESDLSYFWFELTFAFLHDTLLKHGLAVWCFQSLRSRRLSTQLSILQRNLFGERK